MSRKRSRLSVIGIAALSLCLAIGMSSGAEGAKKKKKKGKNQVTVAKTTPTVIPPAPNPDVDSFTAIPLTVGKKFKGKVVSGSSVAVTFSLTGPPVTVPDNGNLGHLGIKLTAPNGRTVFLNYPDDHNISALGPLTLTPNSPNDSCVPSTSPPPPPCGDPEQTLGPPYAGTIGQDTLTHFTGVGARGTWTFKVLNSETGEEFTVPSVSLRLHLQNRTR